MLSELLQYNKQKQESYRQLILVFRTQILLSGNIYKSAFSPIYLNIFFPTEIHITALLSLTCLHIFKKLPIIIWVIWILLPSVFYIVFNSTYVAHIFPITIRNIYIKFTVYLLQFHLLCLIFLRSLFDLTPSLCLLSYSFYVAIYYQVCCFSPGTDTHQ
jgi:hypothetical protein